MATVEVLRNLEVLESELKKLAPAIKHVEMAQQVAGLVETIPTKHLQLLTALKAADELYKEELKVLVAEDISKLTAETKLLQSVTTGLQENTKTEQEIIAALCKEIRLFYDKVDKISFPERLDKLDANIAGIMAGVQAVQSRLDNIERNMLDKLRDNFERQERLLTSIEKASRKQRSFSNILLVISIVILGAVIGYYIVR
jgi:iron uptake system EfeUOB component EfeO/EfeM